MKEHEIRPAKLFEHYLQLAAADVDTYFRDAVLEPLNCPACDQVGDISFSKHGFNYQECADCNTLFVSPRPNAEAFSRYYREAPSVEFWASNFYKETADARRELIWKPKAEMIVDLLSGHKVNPSVSTIIDVGGGYGIFAEEVQALGVAAPVVIEPGPMLADICRGKGLDVVEKFLEDVSADDLPHGSKCFVSFELFEHLHSPRIFLERMKALMGKDDLFIFSTLSGLGVDIRVLWSESQSIHPPHHLNFFNPVSVKMLLNTVGFDVIDVFTPGKLDINILQNNFSDITDPMWKFVLENANDNTLKRLQEIISEAKLSSHMVTVCRLKL